MEEWRDFWGLLRPIWEETGKGGKDITPSEEHDGKREFFFALCDGAGSSAVSFGF